MRAAVLISVLCLSCNPVATALAGEINLPGLDEYKCRESGLQLSPAELFQKKAPSVVLIRTNTTIGTGFVIKQAQGRTWLLTNSHVLKDTAGHDGLTSQLKWHNGTITNGFTVYDSSGDASTKDLAVIRVDGVYGKPLKIRATPPVIGEEVLSIGSPRGLGFSLTRGIVSQVRNQGDLVQFDAPTNPGNSGGPLFDSQGCVLGVITFILNQSKGLNFALGLSPITATLAQAASSMQLSCRSGPCHQQSLPLPLPPLPPRDSLLPPPL